MESSNVKANDIRIGNWVHGFKAYWVIDETDFTKVDSETNTLPYQPILLTDEILLKIGFQISRTINDDAADYFNNATEWVKGDCIILNQDDLYYYVLREINYDIGISYSTKEIKFLHKLQNLYYELEDKELEIK